MLSIEKNMTAQQQYQKAMQDFRSMYRYPRRCEILHPVPRHLSMQWIHIGRTPCAMCSKVIFASPRESATLAWHQYPSGFVIGVEITREPEPLKLPLICSECAGHLSLTSASYPRIVNEEWKRCISAFILPELAELLYDYIFPDIYCPLC